MKFWRVLATSLMVVVIWIMITTTIFILYCYNDLPSASKSILESDSTRKIQINYSNDQKVTIFGAIHQNQITYQQLPDYLIEAVIATEDRQFFSHGGFDISAIFRALYADLRAGKIVQGGSTITQQTAKMLFLTSEKTFKRKTQEILLALRLEQNFSKEEILTLYLNHAYFGAGQYGIADASKYYFGKKIEKINLNEAAMLAGLLKSPSKLSPSKNKELAQERADQVLNNMIDAGYLGLDNVDDLDQKINYQKDKLQKFYFVDFVASELDDFISENDHKANYKLLVQGTLDKKISDLTEEITDNFILQNAKKLGESQLAVIIMNKDGAILAMVGGKNYQQNPFNRAVYAQRQPGSAFKTLIYLSAFEQGFTPDDIMEDKKINIGAWTPDNYQNKYYGEISLRDAFAFSLNSVAVQLAQKLDKAALISIIKQMGIGGEIDKNDLTIALGSAPATLLELTGAYSTIANGGFATMPYVINKISDEKGNILYQHQSLGLPKILDSEYIDMMRDILRAVVLYGTGKNANIGENIYGKTGTSQDYRDAWFVGFNDDYVIGIWIGNDDNSPTNKITGGSLPALLFSKLASAI